MPDPLALTMTSDEVAHASAALRGVDGEALVAYMHRLNLRQSIADVQAPVRALARALHWTDDSGHLTPMGALVSGSLREYTFWIERGRIAHGARRHAALADANYVGKHVLEVGCGFGANLLSLTKVATRVVGLEPVAVFRQMSALLAEREGMPRLELVDGLAERMPLSDGSFDIVLCYSSHQYMDTRVALRDMARVLRPGGQLQLMSGVLDQFVKVMVEHPSLGNFKHLAEVTVNTLAYQATGRRLIKPASLGTMNAPIYPTVPHLRTWMREAGLTFREDLLRRDGSDTIVFGDKPKR